MATEEAEPDGPCTPKGAGEAKRRRMPLRGRRVRPGKPRRKAATHAAVRRKAGERKRRPWRWMQRNRAHPAWSGKCWSVRIQREDGAPSQTID